MSAGVFMSQPVTHSWNSEVPLYTRLLTLFCSQVSIHGGVLDRTVFTEALSSCGVIVVVPINFNSCNVCLSAHFPTSISLAPALLSAHRPGVTPCFHAPPL